MGDAEVYCICRSSDVNRFMIGCDHCEGWYHGDCIKVTEKEAKYIKRYYCRTCIQKNNKLAVVYKTKHKEKVRGRDERERDQEKHRRHHHQPKKHGGEEYGDQKKRRGQDDKKRQEHNRGKHRDDRERSKANDTERTTAEKVDASVESSERGDPPAAVDADNSKLVNTEEKQLSIPPGSSLLKRKSSFDESTARSPQSRTKSDEKFKPRMEEKDKKIDQIKTVSREGNASDASSDDDFDRVRRDRSTAEGSDFSQESRRPSISKSTPKSERLKKRPFSQQPKSSKSSKISRKRRRVGGNNNTSDDGVAGGSVDIAPRQCFGHKCVYVARPGSNYCSDNCGINLASLRIMQTLPDRIREWNLTPCEAEKRNRKELEKIRAKQDTVKARLEQLNYEFKELEDLIEAGKSHSIDKVKEDEDEETDAAEMTVHCVTCGADVQTRIAIRHMERCYNKMESQTSFASKFKTQIEDERMFCDYFNPKDETYCKRLQVLCPEHNPDPKFPTDDEVCGYPMQKEVFGKPVEFCRLSKKKCQTHAFWDKLRRAEIDMERVRQWMKVDELLEQERTVKSAMSNRAGVLGLLLHSTFNHELDDKFQAQRVAAAQKAAQLRKIQQQRQSQPVLQI